MLLHICLSVVLFATIPAWSQLGVVTYYSSAAPADETSMQTPPPVSGASYPTSVGSETRSNYLLGGLMLNIAHDNNVSAGGNATPIGDTIYSISPTLSLDKSTPRQQMSLTYRPGFTFYQNVSTLDSATQSASINLQYRWTEHTSLTFIDSLQKTSNVFDQLYPPSGSNISASVQASPTQVMAPYATLVRNDANVGFTHQIGRNSMLGASVSATDSHYPTSGQISAFYNSSSRAGTGFYSQRLSGRTYLGTTYQYERSEASSPNNSTSLGTQVQKHTIAVFYAIYLSRTVTLSLSGGPQYYNATQLPLPPARSWAPSVVAGIGWQKSRTNLAASYSKTVTGNTGLSGAFDSSRVNSSWSWQIVRTWGMGLGGVYFVDRNLTQINDASPLGGHTISGTVSVRHVIGEHLNTELGYAHVHQSYSGVAAIAATPNSDRIYVSMSYQLSRPLGR